MKYANIIVPAIFSALSIFVSYIISSVQLREKIKRSLFLKITVLEILEILLL